MTDTRHGHAPDSLYGDDHDHADRALGRLLLWPLVLAVCTWLFATPDHAWTTWHWTAAVANALLALALTTRSTR